MGEIYGLRNSTKRKKLGGVKLTGKKRYKMTVNRERERERERESKRKAMFDLDLRRMARI